MANNKIYLDIIVDDKGTTKKVAVDADRVAKSMANLGRSAQTADRNMKGVSKQSANGTKNFSKMAQGMGGLVAVYATAAAQVFAVTAAFSALEKAANFRVVTESQIAFASSTGIGLKSLTSNIKEATDGLVGFEAASQAAAIGAASGLSVTQIENLAEGAKNVSLILGRDVTDSFNRLIRGVTKAEPELLDELGITLRLADATENYAASLKKSAKDLSLYEKSQAIAVEVQTQLDEKYATTAKSVELQANSITKLGVEFEKVLNPLKEFTAFIAEPTAEFLGNNIKALTAAFALLAIPIVKALIPGLEDWAETSKKSATQAANAIREAKEEIEALKQAQAALNQAGLSPGSIAQKAVAGIKTKPGTGLDLIQKGEFEKLTKRQITALRVAAEKGTGAVKNMTKEVRRSYIAALREMEGKSSTTSQKIRSDFERTKTSIVLNIKTIGAQWDLTMARMKKAGAAASRYLNKIMRFAGIVGIIVLIKDVLVGAAKALDIGTQADDIVKIAEDLEVVSDKLKEVQKEYSKFAEIQTKFYDKSQNALPTFEQLGAIGDYIGGNTRAIKEALDVQNKYNAILEKTETQTNAIAEAREKVAKAQTGRRQGRAQENLRSTINEADRGDELDINLVSEFVLGNIDASKKLAEAQREVQSTATAMAAGLRAAKIETQVGGTEFLELVDILAKTGTLTKKQQEEYDRLSESLVGVGGAAKLAKQEYNDLTRLFTQKVTSITQFSTSVTNQIERTEKLIADLANAKTAEAEKYTKELEEQLKFLNKIRDLEIQKKLDDERIARNTAVYAVSSLGGNIATPSGMMQERNLAANYASASAAEADARRRLEMALNPPEGTGVDPTQVQLLTLEVEKLEAASKLAFAQFDEGSRLLSNLAQSFETSMSDAINGLITGTKTLKEAFGDMAKSILTNLAKMIAEMITFKLLSSVLGGSFVTGVSSVPTPTARYGGVLSEGKKMPGYAVGGIAKGPSAGYPAMLHGTEAVVPLPNNRSIPVDLKGAGQQNNVTVNVSVDSQGNAQQNSQSDGMQGANLGNVIAAAVQKELQNQKRSGGILNPYGVA